MSTLKGCFRKSRRQRQSSRENERAQGAINTSIHHRRRLIFLFLSLHHNRSSRRAKNGHANHASRVTGAASAATLTESSSQSPRRDAQAVTANYAATQATLPTQPHQRRQAAPARPSGATESRWASCLELAQPLPAAWAREQARAALLPQQHWAWEVAACPLVRRQISSMSR